MYLHKERETFREIIEQTANYNGRTPEVVEKDYYVTLILKLLAEQLELCVFKGGTSLSKGFHVIDRFSEDIDITFKEHIGESRRKKLKNVVLDKATNATYKEIFLRIIPICIMVVSFCFINWVPISSFGMTAFFSNLWFGK